LGNHAPLHFDISIFDLFAGVIAGATTVIIPEEVTKFPASFTQLIIDSNITVLFTVPFALIQLLLRGGLKDNPMPYLRWIIFGGDPFPIKHLRSLMCALPDTTFDNMYGPAEINGCTHFTVEQIDEHAQSIPIGPINDISQALVVDEQDQEVADLQTGELLVRTPSMMRGYWGRPDLNARAYLDLQAAPNLSHRYYRTGDLVTRDPDGILWFVGRKDRQVKVRGYRVELDEVEAILVSHEHIQEAAVFTARNEENQLEICAAYISKDATADTVKGLSKYLKDQLPNYAVPTQIIAMDSFPRTTSGKIDRKTLAQEQSIHAI
jgi:acyl-coenzyme A synthetase/AMP-(fatty) acid ligase